MSAADPTLVIGRALGTVVVTVRGELDAAAIARLERVLTDLIEGQGNLTVAVDLSRVLAARRAVEAFVSTQRDRFPGANLTVRRPEPAERSQTQALR